MADTATPDKRPIPGWVAPVAVVVVALVVHLGIAFRADATARDSVGFSRLAWQLENPDDGQPPESHRTWLDVVRQSEHPPGYPAAVWLASRAVRALWDAPLPDQMVCSTQVVSLTAALLLALVCYALARELFGPRVGWMAAVAFQILPVPARVTTDGLNDGLHLLGVGIALLCGVRGVRGGGIAALFGCGLASGAAYLVRPEGFLASVAVGLVVVGLVVTRRWQARFAAPRLAVLVCGVMLLAAPYMIAVGGITNKPTGRKLVERVLGGLAQNESRTAPKAATAGAPLASWYVSGVDGSRGVWLVSAIGRELLKAFHYAAAPLALIGLWMARRRFGNDPGLLVPVVFAGFSMLMLVAVAAGSGYVSERHVLPIVFVGCIFAASVIDPIAVRVARVWTRLNPGAVVGFLLVALFASCAPSLIRPLHEGRGGHVAAGRWLAEHANADDAVVDPYDWALFYAGRVLVPSQAPGDEPAVVYAVVEDGKTQPPNSPVWHFNHAQEVARIGQEVFRSRDRRVVVYRHITGYHR